jgi:transposase
MSKKGYRVSKEIKDQVLGRIKNEGVSVAQAAADHGLSVKTIYTWLGSTTKSGVSPLEHRRLKKENDQLKQIIGNLTIKLSMEAKKGL